MITMIRVCSARSVMCRLYKSTTLKKILNDLNSTRVPPTKNWTRPLKLTNDSDLTRVKKIRNFGIAYEYNEFAIIYRISVHDILFLQFFIIYCLNL